MTLAPGPESPDRLQRLGVALRAIETGRFADARDTAAGLLAERPSDVPAEMMLGLALGGMERPRAAAAFLHRARQPGYRHPVYDLVPLLAPGVPRARQFEASLRLSPEDSGLRHACAEALIESGDPRAALDVLAHAPSGAATLMLAGIAKHDLGALDDA